MCGIVGLSATTNVATDLLDSLIHLQHRGQDAAGIVTSNPQFHFKKGHGLVREIFASFNPETLPGHQGIGHSRYPTAGSTSDAEIQPFWLAAPFGISLAHNGNLTNTASLATELKNQYYCLFNTNSDSEILLHLLASRIRSAMQESRDGQSFFDILCHAIQAVFHKAQGSYSVIALIAGKGLVAFRDPHGIRPLVTGQKHHDDGTTDTIIASENTMFHQLGFKQVENIKAGEVLFVDLTGKTHKKQLLNNPFNPCIFEYIYFARPDATLDDISVYRARLRLGENLAKAWQKHYPDNHPDVVIPAPFTSNTAALAFANELNIPYREGLYKNPFIGRTFIMQGEKKRQRSIRHKLVPQEKEIKDKIILILDDSIVRGNTSQEIVSMVKEYHPKAIYFATTCPPIKFPCFYGIDIPTRNELIAAQRSIEAIREYLGVDLLLYQDKAALLEAVTREGEHHIDMPCMACLDGHYVCHDIDNTVLNKLEQKRISERKEEKNNA